MKSPHEHRIRRRPTSGFTLIELVTIIVILGILSAVAVPVYLDYKTDVRKAAIRDALGTMRAAIASYCSAKTSQPGGAPAYPALAELESVLRAAIPNNPLDADDCRNNVVDGTGKAKGTVIGASGGWAYNPTNGQIWANTNAAGENAY